ncbi:MAG: RNA methyltransferase [Chlamydiia bacterium]|nr:RNA methyltransferase [Chlamydiia bacterium]
MIKQITSKEHPLVKHLTRLRQNRDYRHECKRCVIEGEKLVKDVLKLVPYQHLIVSDHAFLPEKYDTSRVVVVTEAILSKISGMKTPPTLIAEVAIPDPMPLDGLNYVLALDRLQDPGNLGTLYRTAWGMGWDGVFLIGSNVDPYNDKTLRASQGTTLMMPTVEGSRDDFLKFLKQNDLPAFAADLKGKAPEKIKRGCLILGREGEGLDPKLKEMFQSISLPMQNHVESLNVAVAGGILLYLLRGVK